MNKLQRILASASRSANGSAAPIGILDGGQGTHLSALGVDITSSLFGTSLLASDSPSDLDLVKRLHGDYLSAGAQIIGTLTYQLADLACEKAAWSKGDIQQRRDGMWQRGIRGAHEARREWIAGKKKMAAEEEPLISLTLGPYGACLANGAEYTGEYPSLSHLDLIRFHKDRLLSAITSPDFFSTIDLIAFETIPRLDEADAIFTALEEVLQENPDGVLDDQTLPSVYISFVFPAETKGTHLPYPQAGAKSRTRVEEIAKMIKERQGADTWPVAGVGINCTVVSVLKRAVEYLTEGAVQSGQTPMQGLHLFLYPDGGLVWDATNRCWLDPSSGQRTGQTPSPASWAEDLHHIAETAAVSGVWAGVWMGGCCMTGPREIRELRRLISSGKGEEA